MTILSEEALAEERVAFEAWAATEWATSSPPAAAWIGWQGSAAARRTPQTPMVGAEPMEAVIDGPPIVGLYDDSDPVMAGLHFLGRDGYATDRQRAVARAAHAEILRLRALPVTASPLDRASVTVKALIWRDLSYKGELDLIAHTAFHTYQITKDDTCEWPIILRPFGVQSNYLEIDEAKAAAQADYDKRIRTALKVSP